MHQAPKSQQALRTRVKICGITNLEDALCAIDAGADALGFNLFKKSKRYITPVQLKVLFDALPPLVGKVGLFVNEDADAISEICKGLHFDLLQFHGDEDNRFCTQFELPFIKAIRAREQTQLVKDMRAYPNSCGLLIDAHVDGSFGGTGQVFDWSWLKPSNLKPANLKPANLKPENLEVKLPIILAGGLNVGNVSQAIKEAQPYAVDLSSGVELMPGKKDHKKIQDFMNAVKQADGVRFNE